MRPTFLHMLRYLCSLTSLLIFYSNARTFLLGELLEPFLHSCEVAQAESLEVMSHSCNSIKTLRKLYIKVGNEKTLVSFSPFPIPPNTSTYVDNLGLHKASGLGSTEEVVPLAECLLSVFSPQLCLIF